MVCSGVDNKVMSWSEFGSSGSECSASEAESMGCPQGPHPEYRGVFCEYKMVEDYSSDSLESKH